MTTHPKGWSVAECPDPLCDFRAPYLIASRHWRDAAFMVLERHMRAKKHFHADERFGDILGNIFGGAR